MIKDHNIYIESTTPGEIAPSMRMEQMDVDSNNLIFRVTRNYVAYNMTDKTAKLAITKIDGNVVILDCIVVNTLGGVISVVLTDPCLVLAGWVSCELRIYSDQTVVISDSFKFYVVESLPDRVGNVEVLAEGNSISLEEVKILADEDHASILNIGNALDDIETLTNEHSAQLDKNVQQLNTMSLNAKYPPSPFIAIKMDGSDDSVALQAMIDYLYNVGGGTLYIPRGTCKIDTSLILKNYVSIIGDGISTILQTNNGISVIKGANTVRNTQIKDLMIMGTNPYSVGSIGIEYNEDSGGTSNLIENVVISHFEKGISARDSWFHNLVKNVRINDSHYSLYFKYKTSGSTINNTFENIYIDKPSNYPIYMTSCRRMVFINPSIDLTGFATGIFASTNVEATFIGGNFEGSVLASGESIVNILSNSTITFIGTRLAPHSSAVTGYGFNIDGISTIVTLINCTCDKITNFAQVRTALKTGTRILNMSPQIDTFINASGSSGGAMYKNINAPEHKQSIEIDLSESAVDFPIFFSGGVISFVSATLIYTEATSADTGVVIELKDSTYTYATVTTESNKALFSTTAMSLSRTRSIEGNPLRVTCAGGKVGVGKCVLELIYLSE